MGVADLIARGRRPLAGQAERRLGGRLRWWWSRGRPASAPSPSAARVATPEGEETPLPAIYWTPEAIEAAQLVWGPDHLGPTDDAYVRHVLKPLGIRPSLSIVEIGSGLGGGARAIAADYDAWVTGLEPDPVLAAAGMDLSIKAGVARKAPIKHFEPAGKPLRSAQYDRIIVRNALGSVAGHADLLQMIRDSMKGRAQLLVTDFVVTDDAAHNPRVAAWREAEPGETRPMTATALLRTLKELDLRVHVAEDESAEIARIITGRWERMRIGLKPTSLRPALVEPVLREGRRWQHCVDALESGSLRYYRIVASA